MDNEENEKINNETHKSTEESAIETKIKDVVTKGAEVSKSAFEKAGNAIQIFTDKSVLKIDRSQLISKKNKKYQELGEMLSQLLAGKKIVISSKNEDKDIQSQIKELETVQKEIDKLNKQIQEKTKELESYKK